ncbi:MAG TPA: hypothetical protein VLQ67_06735, partial [Arachnia sp.]|nr:hypothetical protein [Arachnia sp.]
VLAALLLTGCGLDPTISQPSLPAPEPDPSPSQSAEAAEATAAVAGLVSAIEAGRSAQDAPASFPAWADAAVAALGAVLDRLRAADPVAGGEPVFELPPPSPATLAPAGLAESLAGASTAAEDSLRRAALAAEAQPLRLLYASAACASRGLATVGAAPVEGGAEPRHFQGTTVAASLPIALSHSWALIYGLGVGIGRLDRDDPLRGLGTARLATAKELRNELRDALPGAAPVQPATFDLPTAMTTSDEIRAGWGALELGLLEGLGRLVAAGGPGRERWLELMLGAVDSVGGMGWPLPHWPGWV